MPLMPFSVPIHWKIRSCQIAIAALDLIMAYLSRASFAAVLFLVAGVFSVGILQLVSGFLMQKDSVQGEPG